MNYTPEFPAVIDSTMRADFVACPQRFYQGYIRKRAPKGDSIHLVAGAAYAKGLEVVRTLVWGPEKLPLDDAIAEAIPHVWKEYGEVDSSAAPHKSPNAVVTGLIAYFDKYNPTTDHLQPYIKKNGMPAVEFTFTFPLQILHPDTGEPLLYAGRFDMVGVYNDTLWVVDDKTASSLGPSWDASWRLRAQLTGYTFAAQQYGLACQGAIIRGISFLKTGAYGFSEPIEYRAQWEIERWWVQLHRDVARMVDCWRDKDEEHPWGYWDWALNDACNEYGGCAFNSLCTVSNPEDWAKEEFAHRDWSPLDKNPAGRKPITGVLSS